MAESINGYESDEVIRQWVGSPGTTFAFTKVMQSVMIDCLGSPGVYFNFTGSAITVGSTVPKCPQNQSRSFDIRAGSIRVLSQTTGSVEVQVFGGGN